MTLSVTRTRPGPATRQDEQACGKSRGGMIARRLHAVFASVARPLSLALMLTLPAFAAPATAAGIDREEAQKQTALALGLCINNIKSKRDFAKAMTDEGWGFEIWDGVKYYHRNSFENIVSQYFDGAGRICSAGAARLPEGLAMAQAMTLIKSMGGEWGRVEDFRNGEAFVTLLPSGHVVSISVYPEQPIGFERYTTINYFLSKKKYRREDVFIEDKAK